ALGKGYPIIGVGGIMSGDDAAAKIRAGADVVQIYSGLIYTGPGLVSDAALAIKALRHRELVAALLGSSAMQGSCESTTDLVCTDYG
ncbi:MAG: hypothetical protein KBT18_02335, partial [Comamonas sp.]|nr:hypothetical protein [Candidatus Comamonas equi]